MTPDDIRSQRFSTRLLQGLSPEEVSAFLEDVAEAFAAVQQANATLGTRVKALEDEILALSAATPLLSPPAAPAPASGHIEELRSAVLQEVEALLHDAHAQVTALLESAQAREATVLRDAEAMRARRQVEADALVTEATVTADAILAAARDQEAAIRGEIDRLTQSHQQLVDGVRATLDTYHQWLATVDPRGRARSRREVLDAAAGDSNVGAADESRVG
jgi:DivIVA domain-containing protein